MNPYEHDYNKNFLIEASKEKGLGKFENLLPKTS